VPVLTESYCLLAPKKLCSARSAAERRDRAQRHPGRWPPGWRRPRPAVRTRRAGHRPARRDAWVSSTGRLAPGAKLPTLDELAAQYLCSLAVVRTAVELLRQQGLVVTQQGRGTFVRDRTVTRRHGVERYSP